MDTYLDGKIEDALYEKKHSNLLVEINKLRQEKNLLSSNKNSFYEKLIEFFELCKNPLNTYLNANFEEKRNFVELMTSNLVVSQKTLEITMVSLFNSIANRSNLRLSAPDLHDNRKPSPQNYPSKLVYSSIYTSPIISKPLDPESLRFLLKKIKLDINKQDP